MCWAVDGFAGRRDGASERPHGFFPRHTASRRHEKHPDDLQNVADKELEAELQRREQERFEKVEEQIRQAIETVPELKNLAQNLLIDQTPEGLRIQIVDQEGKPMFPLGKSEPLPEALLLLKLVTRVIMDLPNMISIRGHTDSCNMAQEPPIRTGSFPPTVPMPAAAPCWITSLI